MGNIICLISIIFQLNLCPPDNTEPDPNSFCVLTNLPICEIKIDGTREYLLYKDDGGTCKTTCAKEDEIDKKLNEGFRCDYTCQVDCPSKDTNICEDKDGKKKYWIFRSTIGQCEVKCEEEKEFVKLFAKGWDCNRCVEPCSQNQICELKDGLKKYTIYREESDGDCTEKCEALDKLTSEFGDGFSCLPCNYVDICDSCGKPKRMEFLFTGESTGRNKQADGKVVVTGTIPGDATSAYIIGSEKEDGTGDVYFSGVRSVGSTFTLETSDDKFPSKTFIIVKQSSSSPIPWQTIEFHTGCSEPLSQNDQFGTAQLIGYSTELGRCF